MAYPTTPLPVVVEFWNGTAWVDISAYTYSRNGAGITIIRGFPDEASGPQPSSCTFQLNNRDGRFTPLNPTGPYYGLIGRNTQVRVSVTGYGTRFVGEISEWPSRWDVTGRDVWVPVTAQGVLRRLQQGSSPVNSPYRSAVLSAEANDPFYFFLGYWPMEDGTSSTSFGSALNEENDTVDGVQFTRTVPIMSYSGTRPAFASTGPFLGSDSLPILGATTTLMAPIPLLSSRSISDYSVSLHLDIPATTGWTDGTPILWISQSLASSTIATWEIRYVSGGGGDLEVRALDSAGTQLATSGTLDYNIDGTQLRLFFRVSSDGVDAGWVLKTQTLNSDGTAITQIQNTSSFAGLVGTRAMGLRIAPRGGLTDMGVGQATVQAFFVSDIDSNALLSFAGETAADRAQRLIEDRAITSTTLGTAADTQAMGPQATPSTLLNALNETWVADQGLLHETVDTLGLTFRTLDSLYNQTAGLALDYTGAGEVAPDLEPTEDDLNVRNDVTVTRKNGSSARYVDSTSRMGTADPPTGVGVYDTSVEINIQTDTDLIQHASWRVHLGTVDESRYPSVHVNMAALAKAGQTTLMTNAAGLEVGDRITITNLPSWVPPGDADLMLLGYTETMIHPIDWDLVFNCAPYSPWRVAVLAEESMTLLTAETTSSTAWRIGCQPDFTTVAADLPVSLTVDGEEVSVTAAAAASVGIAAGTPVHGDNASLQPTHPSHVEGDLLIVYCAIRSSGVANPNTPAGYTTLVADNNHRVFAKYAASAAEPAPTVTFSGGSAGDTTSAVSIRVSGVQITVLNSKTQINGSAQDIAFPAYVIEDNVQLLQFCWKQDDYTSVAVGGGMTEVVEASSITGNDQSLYVARGPVASNPTPIPAASHVVTGGAAAISRVILFTVPRGVADLTVTRSVNGVVTSHAQGATVQITDPEVLAL